MAEPLDETRAFPGNCVYDGQFSKGMGILDYFAASALQGLIASNFYDRYYDGEGQAQRPAVSVAVEIAYEYAREMVAYRDQCKETYG